MRINEIVSLQERVHLRGLTGKHRPKTKTQNTKSAAKQAAPKLAQVPARKSLPKPKPFALPKTPPKPFNSQKTFKKVVGPKQNRTLNNNPNMQGNSFLKPVPQNIISSRDSVDMDLYRKMELIKVQAQKNGIDSKMSNREIDSKSRGS